MPVKFDFISPGVQFREIDESQLPPAQEADGIILIGRARTGPAMKPVKVNNLNDFIEVFGNPIDGVRQTDPWRQGNTGAPNYAAYAAQAYLAAGVGPVKFVRLLGLQKDSDNKAGWTMGNDFNTSVASNKGAYGLFLMPSSSATTADATLAAVFYLSGAAVALSGTVVSSSNGTATDSVAHSASTLVISDGAKAGFNLVISSSDNTSVTHSIDFDNSSARYIRSVLNTDPTKFKNSKNYGSDKTDEKYFLGETFDVNVARRVTDISSSVGKVYGFIMGLNGSDSEDIGNWEQELTEAKTGWFISPQPAQKKLFRLVALNSGTEFQKNFYCVVKDLRLASGRNGSASFSLQIVKRGTNLSSDIVVEEFTGLNLDNTSADYIDKRIGNFFQSWDKTNERFINNGKYPNRSDYIRVETADGVLKSDIPFGWAGFKADAESDTIAHSDTGDQGKWFDGKASIQLGNVNGKTLFGIHNGQTITVKWPVFGLSSEGTKNGSDYGPTDTFGLRHALKSRTTHDMSVGDVAGKRANFTMHLDESDSLTTCAQVFTLDNITSSATAGLYYHVSGGYGSTNKSITEAGGGPSAVISLKIKQFAAPFFGGNDGVDIRYANPFSDKRISSGGADGYPLYTIDQALEMVRYQEDITCEIMSIPGVVNSTLGDKLISIAENRGDCLAIIDLKGIERDTWETESAAERASLSTIEGTMESRNIDSSYAASYFPNIRMVDNLNGNETILNAPPSVAAIGAIAKSDSLSHPWFAPAGFNRGGIGRLGGSSGPSVVGTVMHLPKEDRDTLYDIGINPIAKFPSTGDTVIFGQKTLQVAASALDRINVRRLMIFLKRQIGIIADTILFDQNVQVTWNRFKSQANSILSNVQADAGITEYKLVLDETTTTPDLIDRNILYAKIFVKPARSIEFIAIDFIITQTGVEF